jgi:hypothetical protein
MDFIPADAFLVGKWQGMAPMTIFREIFERTLICASNLRFNRFDISIIFDMYQHD